jgi:hypothetical protein
VRDGPSVRMCGAEIQYIIDLARSRPCLISDSNARHLVPVVRFNGYMVRIGSDVGVGGLK